MNHTYCSCHEVEAYLALLMWDQNNGTWTHRSCPCLTEENKPLQHFFACSGLPCIITSKSRLTMIIQKYEDWHLYKFISTGDHSHPSVITILLCFSFLSFFLCPVNLRFLAAERINYSWKQSYLNQLKAKAFSWYRDRIDPNTYMLRNG